MNCFSLTTHSTNFIYDYIGVGYIVKGHIVIYQGRWNEIRMGRESDLSACFLSLYLLLPVAQRTGVKAHFMNVNVTCSLNRLIVRLIEGLLASETIINSIHGKLTIASWRQHNTYHKFVNTSQGALFKMEPNTSGKRSADWAESRPATITLNVNITSKWNGNSVQGKLESWLLVIGEEN